MTLDHEPGTTPTFDLVSYLRRIDYRGDLRPTRAVLEALHQAHATHIPYENLDVLLKRPILLDLASLQAKLVHAGRGGYCYEQNSLFAAALREIGFSVTTLAARVRFRSTKALPRTHMTLVVQAEGANFLADVGFGSSGLILPIPLASDVETDHFAWRYRIVAEESLRVLQLFSDGAWVDLYAFSLEPQEPADYEMANYYVSTHPASRFVHTLTAQKITKGERHTLRDREYSVDRGSGVTTRLLTGDDDVPALLTGTFGLRLPDHFHYSFAGKETPMSNDIHASAARGFSRAADSYQRGRPDYPQDAVERLVSWLDLAPGKVVVEPGAGTGKFTQFLVPSGARIVAVEPVAQMRAKLSELLPAIEAVDGTAEIIPLLDGSADALVVAQAFHWFRAEEALAEFHRVLRPEGRLALIWNRRDESVDWVAQLARIVDRFEEGTPRYKSGQWRKAFDSTALFTPLRHAEFGYLQVGTPETVLDRVASMSMIAALPEEIRGGVLEEVRALIREHPETRGRETIAFPYRTDVFAASRS